MNTQTKAKHTPGEWIVKYEWNDFGHDPKTDGWVVHTKPDERKWPYSFRAPGLTDDECAANAHLIAACPRMYDFVESKAKKGDKDAQEILRNL